MVEWLTRGVERLELSGEGGTAGVAFIAYRLVHAPLTWTHLAHRCLPVTDPLYPCRPAATNSDADEARGRLPTGVQAQWTARYADGFAAMTPTLRAVATRATPPPLAPASPDDPTPNADGAAALRIASLEPHVARMVGLAYDDPIPVDGSLYTYRVVGRWRSGWIELQLRTEAVDALADQGVQVSTSGSARLTGGKTRLQVDFGRAGAVAFTFPEPLSLLAMRCPASPFAPRPDLSWVVTDDGGVTLADGVLGGLEGTLMVDLAGIADGRTLQLTRVTGATGPLVMATLAWATGVVEETGLLPGVAAAEPGPSAGPSWVTVRVGQPGGTAGPIEGEVDWALDAAADGSVGERAAIFHQVAAAQLGTEPAAPQPQAPAFDPKFLLRDRGLITVPPAVAAKPAPRRLLLDRGDTGAGLSEGWRCWWVRGVDLFGRASLPTGPQVRQILDQAPPPAPGLLLAEYAQHDLPPVSAALLGQSTLGQAWRAAHPDKDAVVAVWAWTPELDDQCRDVDGWRLHLRRPVPFGPPRQGEDPQTTYAGVGWGSPIVQLGPVATHMDGIVASASVGVTTPFAVGAVTAIDQSTASCRTTLALDTGAGALIGATLVSPSGGHFPVVRNGEGPQVTLDVQHDKDKGPPQPGAGWTLLAGTTEVVTVATNMTAPALPAGTIVRRFAGALIVGADRLAVLGMTLAPAGAIFVCRQGPGTPVPPASGTPVRWYPAWAAVVEDTGFGPRPSATAPVAQAQVAAVAVRRWATRPLASPPSRPGGIVAADTRQPPAPVLPTIPTGPYCAELATRADWYGVSRYTLSWPTQPDLAYVVYRALGDAVLRLDLAEHTRGGTRPHTPPREAWAADIWNTPARRQLVEADLATLDQALRLEAGPARDTAVAAAYAGLHADTQRIIAAQPYARPAFTALHGDPLPPTAVPFTDELDGRSRARWFYRLAARSQAGVQSDLSPPTPPICCPDVVPPPAPVALLALAADRAVRLRWSRSPSPDVARYLVYRGDEAAGDDVRAMTLIATLAPTATATPQAGEVQPTAVPDQPLSLEYKDEFKNPRNEAWRYRIVAEDASGNRSTPSAVLTGRPLRPPPSPPTWDPPVRGATTARLAWQHLTDERLSCLVERRPSGGGLWFSVSGWLPRGVYRYDDTPPDLSAAWDYRLRVRDHLGQVAESMPITTLAAV
jgi:hypothetical protein